MKIAMISEHASPLATLGGADGGGQNVYVAELSRQLALLGHEVDVFTRREDETSPEVVPFCAGVRVVQVDAGPPVVLAKEHILPFMDDFAHAMLGFVERGAQYDLIHANFFMSGMVGLEVGQVLGLPLVITFHALGRVRRLHQKAADGFSDARFAIEDRLVAQADRIIAECPEDERDLQVHYHADPLRLRMIPCGYDPEEFTPMCRAEARAALALPLAGPIVLQLGRLVPRKGIDTAIAGLARANAAGAGAHLLVVGGPHTIPNPGASPEMARLMAVARAEGVEDAVTFVGSRSRKQLARYYNAADVFVTTPWYEPFGITPLEAMACGVPVIGSDVGGLRYTVVEGETGYRVPPRDPDALGARLAELLGDPARARAMGQAGLARVRERFTWRRVALQVEEVYRETLDKRAAAPSVAAPADEEAAVNRAFTKLVDTVERARPVLNATIRDAAEMLATCLLDQRKVLVCGNGGSAADAQHFAAEFVGRFKADARPALPVIALNADSAFLTAWANDAGFEDVFARGVRAFGQSGDVLVVISTSGRSPNIVAALREAKKRGLRTVAILGGSLSPAVSLADVAIRVPSTDTARIQEVHTLILHLICELVEARALAQDGAEQAPLTVSKLASIAS